jgi:ferrochelatase
MNQVNSVSGAPSSVTNGQQSSSATVARRAGVLLLNVGTPNSPAVKDVRRYLREFLTDGRVLTMPGILRWLLVYGIIAPFRGPKSAHAYRSIWSDRGSPLLINGQNLAASLAQELGPGFVVKLAMRYGHPATDAVVSELLDQHQVDQLIVVPLYPQYSSSATGTAIERIFSLLSRRVTIPSVRVVGDFFEHPGFIAAQASIAKERLAAFNADHVLMSYHGLPESHVQATAPSHCLKQPDCCAAVTTRNRFCYRAQCYATSRRLGEALGLPPGGYTVAFQSRLGRTPWIKPYTDQILADIRQSGVRRLAVVVPSFVADCLETIEEIGDRARADWQALGGEDFALVPCVNHDPRWVKALATMIR